LSSGFDNYECFIAEHLSIIDDDIYSKPKLKDDLQDNEWTRYWSNDGLKERQIDIRYSTSVENRHELEE
jgi:hypothetical protein